MSDNITFGTLEPDGFRGIVEISRSDILQCPFVIILADHYENGICKCHDPEYRKMMIKEWGYTREDFAEVGINE